MDTAYSQKTHAVNVIKKISAARRGTAMKRMLMFFRKTRLPTLLLLPGSILLFTFFIYPTFNMFFSSFREINLINGTSKFVGFENYIAVFKDDVFIKSLLNTVVYVVSATAILVPFSFLVSLLVDSCSKMGLFIRGVLYLPAIIAMSVAALLWQFILDPDIGFIAQALANLNIKMPSLFFIRSPNYCSYAISDGSGYLTARYFLR